MFSGPRAVWPSSSSDGGDRLLGGACAGWFGLRGRSGPTADGALGLATALGHDQPAAVRADLGKRALPAGEVAGRVVRTAVEFPLGSRLPLNDLAAVLGT